MSGSSRLCLGVISGAHGVRGEVRIRPFTEVPEDIATYGLLEDREGGRKFEILSARPAKGGVVARLAGISDRESAEALKGLELYVDRGSLPDQEDGTWYHADLIGLAAREQGGTEFGRIVAVQNFGAGDLLEIEPAGGGSTVLVPFTEDIVPRVDIEAGWVVIDPPEGLLD